MSRQTSKAAARASRLIGGGQEMTAKLEVIVDPAAGGEEPLSVAR